MKTIKILGVVTAMAWGCVTGMAQTSETNFTFSVNQAVPQNSVFGLTLATNLTVLGGSISSVTVGLDISGGFNGDLYAYLAGPTGGFAVLLNRVGVGGGNLFGYSDSGLNVTFSDSATSSIHYYQNVSGYDISSGTALWQPDGENIDPNSPAANFTGVQTAMLSSFVGIDPNGTWTLFLANLSSGGESAVVNWSLNIVTVPEPGTLALMAAGAASLLLFKRRRNA
jgi:subtilisin-like proprotein convertase family protein